MNTEEKQFLKELTLWNQRQQKHTQAGILFLFKKIKTQTNL